MTTLQLTVTLPDELVDSARTKGLLAPDRVGALIQRELERELAIDKLFRQADALAALEPFLTADEINIEIEAVRRQRARRS
jgi:hypothetical protein